MYLVDTDVIGEARKGARAHPGVRAFFAGAARDAAPVYLSVVTIGELRQGVERIRHRGDAAEARRLERWLTGITARYADAILPVDGDVAHIWGRLRVPKPEHPLDKLIAATALMHDLTLVTRNTAPFEATRVVLLNPCAE